MDTGVIILLTVTAVIIGFYIKHKGRKSITSSRDKPYINKEDK